MSHTARIHGVITDAADNSPVEGAELRLGLHRERTTEFYDCQAVYSDSEGRYEASLEREGSDTEFLRIEVRSSRHAFVDWPYGYVPQKVWADDPNLAKITDDREVDFQLNPGFSIDIQVKGSDGTLAHTN